MIGEVRTCVAKIRKTDPGKAAQTGARLASLATAAKVLPMDVAAFKAFGVKTFDPRS
ncbi:MAG TPA: hypothetical protein PKJ45_03240 [Rubrivivax sp.]|nr:hypothetical protein [Burkholderiales bacterium]HNU10363.1 hypothetical protein [Rubrivivax sp.]